MKKIDEIKVWIRKIDELERERIKCFEQADTEGMDIDERGKKMEFFKEKEKILIEQLEKLGLEFKCGNYGQEYCLDFEGLKVVLKAIEEEQ